MLTKASLTQTGKYCTFSPIWAAEFKGKRTEQGPLEPVESRGQGDRQGGPQVPSHSLGGMSSGVL